MIKIFTKKESIILLIIVTIGAFLRLYAISDQMHFISDQGWFFLSAKEILTSKEIPLVGITSSHTWLFQGPIWTYILAGVLWIGEYDPISAGYFSVFLDILTIIFLYKVSKELFSKDIAIISSILYATSPLIIIYSRMPYHTSPIPFLSVLFLLTFYRWIKGNKFYFPILIFICSLLYNFELATVLFPIALFMFLIYGIWKKKKWAKIFNLKIILLTILGMTPMVPIVIYDFKNGFFQTVKFSGWLFFQALGSIGIKIIPQDPHPTWQSFLTFFSYELRRTVFYRSEEISIVILFSVILLNLTFVYNIFKKKKFKTNYLVFYFISLILFGGFISQRESSGAYLTMLFPYLILFIALGTSILRNYKKLIAYSILIFIIPAFNSYLVLKEYRSSEGGGLKKIIKASEFIANDSKRGKISLERKNFKSNINIDQYRYLVWWKGGDLDSKSNVEYGIYNATEGIPKRYIYSDGSVYITKTKK